MSISAKHCDLSKISCEKDKEKHVEGVKRVLKLFAYSKRKKVDNMEILMSAGTPR